MIRLLLQTVVLALGQIWTNKLRAALAMLMIVIGAAALIMIVGASQGFKETIVKEFASFGANKVWVFPRRPPEARDRFSWRQIKMNVEEADGILANCPAIDRLTPILEFTAELEYADRSRPFVQIRGIRPVWHQIEDRAVLDGRPFSQIDMEAVRNVCLVNDKAIEELALPGGGVGANILVGGRRFLIIGIVETKAVAPMFNDNGAQAEVYIPLNTAVSMKPDWGIYVVAQTKQADQFEDAKEEIRFFMRKHRALHPGDPDTFGVEAIEAVIAQVSRVLNLVTVFLGGLVLVALLVGGVGIMVIQLVSVTERTREIGLRKAVGARPAVVMLQFLVEAVVLCALGAAIGLAIGYAVVLILRIIPKSPLPEAQVPIWAVLLASIFSVGVGVIFGMFPAMKAARLDPIDALRHE